MVSWLSPCRPPWLLCVCVSVCARTLVGVCLLLARHVKDSRRCGEIQRWACFITSHIETNLCTFTWRTASYSLTKLASRCGVRGPPQARRTTLLHTHTVGGRYMQSCNNVFFFSLSLLSCKNSQQNKHKRMSHPSFSLFHTHTHTPLLKSADEG